MSYENMSPADYAAVNGNRNNNGWGNDWSSWIIIFLIFALCGWGGNGFGGFGGYGGGTAAGYTLASDFATIQRQLSDGFGGVEKGLDTIRNGLCDGFYTEAQLVNGVNTNILQGNNALQAQLADCCCKTQSGIERVNTGAAMNTAQIIGAIKDCCCDTEKQFMQAQFAAQQYNCATLAAIDKLGDRIFDRMTNDQLAAKDAKIAELYGYLGNQRLREDIRNDLRPAPVPAYVTCNPWAASYGFGYDNGGCNRCA